MRAQGRAVIAPPSDHRRGMDRQDPRRAERGVSWVSFVAPNRIEVTERAPPRSCCRSLHAACPYANALESTEQMLRPSQKDRGSRAMRFGMRGIHTHAPFAAEQSLANFRGRPGRRTGLADPDAVRIIADPVTGRASMPQRCPVRNSTSQRARTAAINSDMADVCCLPGSFMLRSFSSLEPLPSARASAGVRCARRSNVACVPRNPNAAHAAARLRLKRGPGRRRTGRRMRNKAMGGSLLGGRR